MACCAAALALGPAATAAAAAAAAPTAVSRTVEIAFAPDGSFTERVAMRVRLAEAGDLARFSPWLVPLDENRTLVTISATAWRPDGSVLVLGEDDATTVEGLAGGGVLHSSAGYRMLELPPLPAGSTLQLAYEVREEPWLDSTALPLFDGDSAIEGLVVRVSGLPATPRWRLDPPQADGDDRRWTVEEMPDGLRIEASDLDPAGDERPVLRLAWGPGGTWADVGRWYEGLVEPVARRPAEVAALARDAAAGEATARARTARLLDEVRRRVRYVAVEVGVGGYRPSPPGEVLGRRWGDCKDMSFLLVDLLAEAGVTAYPALARLDEERRVDADFPAADQFNHLIVAVPVAQVDPEPGDAASDRYLFLDPTQESGGLGWLHPALQGQRVLVVRGAESELAAVPVLASSERRELAVALRLEPSGDAEGEAVVTLVGRDAWSLSSATSASDPDQLGVVARRVLEGLLAGAAVGPPRWRQGDDRGTPVVELSAPVRFAGLARGRSAPSLALPGTDAFPRLDAPAAGTEAAVRPVVWTASWQVELPAGWCPPEASEDELANGAGRFRQTIEPVAPAGPGERGGFRVERRGELPHRWIGPGLAEEARELALAESRAARRRIRLACPADG